MRTITTDIVVVGGGVSGSVAAVSAARQGKRVFLAESLNILGGMLTAGGLAYGMDYIGKGGLCLEFREKLLARGAYRLIHEKPLCFMLDVAAAAQLLEELALAAGVEIGYQHTLKSVQAENGRITSAVFAAPGGEVEVTAETWIDATGDGVLARMAGCSFLSGQEGTGKHQPASVLALVTGVPATYQYNFTKKDKEILFDLLKNVGHICSYQKPLLKPMPLGDLWTLAVHHGYDVDPGDPASVSEAYRKGKEETWHAVQCLRTLPGWEKLTVAAFSSYLGQRDSYQIRGRYVLTEKDLVEGSVFPDGICTVHQPVDIHALHAKESFGCTTAGVKMQPYQIPLSALQTVDVENLLICGRCLSGDFVAQASYRVAGNAMASGEAAGYAAATGCTGPAVKAYMQSKGYELA